MNTKSLAALVSATLLTACATAPASRPPAAVAAAPAPPAHLSRYYLYAQRGQSAEQQDRDRFECFNWASQQSGFDPSRAAAASSEARAIRAAHQRPVALASYEQQAAEHRRAMSACLEGRGYVVK